MKISEKRDHIASLCHYKQGKALVDSWSDRMIEATYSCANHIKGNPFPITDNQFIDELFYKRFTDDQIHLVTKLNIKLICLHADKLTQQYIGAIKPQHLVDYLDLLQSNMSADLLSNRLSLEHIFMDNVNNHCTALNYFSILAKWQTPNSTYDKWINDLYRRNDKYEVSYSYEFNILADNALHNLKKIKAMIPPVLSTCFAFAV